MDFSIIIDPGFDSLLLENFLDLIYHAIERDQAGKVIELLNAFIKRRPEWTSDDFRKSGSTPLICACQHGNLAVAQFLIESLGLPVDQCGTVRFEHEVIEDAPPIWVASAAGHIAVVKYLLQHGADVNAVTSTNSTSLRAACFDGHIDIVEFLIHNGADIEIANQHNHTCLMIACYKKHFEIVKVLVKSGSQVNRRSRKGNTALHDCAEGGCVEIMKFLLDNGATFQKDEYGVSPLMAAAISAHTSVVRFIMDTYICPITDETNVAQEVDRGSRVSPNEQIDVLEMLGCSMIDKKQDLTEGLKWWKRASEMRVLYHSVGLVEAFKKVASPVPEMSNIIEYQTVDDVEVMQAEFTPDYIRMQSLLVRQRLLGFKHPDTTYYIRYRGAVLADAGDYNRCLKLWRYVLRNLVENLDALCCNILLCAIQSYVELFGFLFHTQNNETFRHIHPGVETNLVEIEDVLSVLKACIALYKFHKAAAIKNPADHFISFQNKTDLTCMKLICKLIVFFSLVREDELKPKKKSTDEEQSIICKKMEDYSEEIEFLLAEVVASNIQDTEGNTLLHVIMSSECCGVERHRITEYPHLPAINILLRVYKTILCDVDLTNNKRFTALELFFKNLTKNAEIEKVGNVLKLFESYGSHIDFNADYRPDFCPLFVYNERASKHNMAMFTKRLEAIQNETRAQNNGTGADNSENQSSMSSNPENFPMFPLKVQSLQCLSAIAVLENECDFSSLCEHLKKFVKKH